MINTSTNSCELRTDTLNRNLYATDASIYQILPQAVALPKTPEEVAEAFAWACEKDLSITCRGAGTGLAGGAIGDGLIVDLARYNRQIFDFNREERTVRVQAGVVLDQLNAFLQPHGLTFGPDVATSSRATLGGMIGNNSSGARAPRYGTTVDHIRSMEIITADGRIETLSADTPGLQEWNRIVLDKVKPHEAEIQRRFHAEICKRWPGYGFDRYLQEPANLSKLIGGSEGTLAAVFSAQLNLVPLPKSKGIALFFFDSIKEAMAATLTIMPLQPASVEHIDDVVFNETRGQRQFREVRQLLKLDEKPCKSILLVEFYDDDVEKLAALEKLQLGVRYYRCKDAKEMALVWNMRKAGLSLLTGCKGAAKPTAGIEDVAVPPAHLPEYVDALMALMDELGMRASYYGHAASGLLHIRPVVDLHKAEDIVRYRKLAEGVSALTRRFHGSLAAEHGVGIARTEFMEEQVGPELLELMRQVKAVFDPDNRLNPGKIFDPVTYRIDTQLRQGADSAIPLPFEPTLAFAAKDGSFIGNLEQCNGCGGCRKDTPTMCPTFQATGEDIMATRGRANIIRAVLEGRIDPDTPAVLSEELEEAISNCLSCKACATECPSNVNLSLLKAELLYARLRRQGIPLGVRMVSRVDLLNRLGSLTPRLSNAGLNWRWVRWLMQKYAGISPLRPLPTFAEETFTHWFQSYRRQHPIQNAPRGRVLLWDDCFVRHNEPNIGKAAVQVLEAAGYEVVLPEGHACCGRPAFSTGRLDVARRFGEQNIDLLKSGNEAILFLEPSCFSMFKEDYRELGIAHADGVAERVFLFEEFMMKLLKETPDALPFNAQERHTAIHAHCHAKSLTDTNIMPELARCIPENQVELLDTGCCGMAGQFGALDKKYELSLQVAQPLVEKINALPEGAHVIASGTSCRHQINHLTSIQPLHMAELLAEALCTSTNAAQQ